MFRWLANLFARPPAESREGQLIDADTHRPRWLADPGGLLVALLLLAIVAVCSFLSWQQYVRYANETRQTNGALSALNEVITSVQTAEASQRGYLLTSDPLYLTEYNKAVAQTHQSLSALAHLSPEISNPRLLPALQSAVEQKLLNLALVLQAARAGRFKAAIDQVKSSRGYNLALQIHDSDRACNQQLQASLRNFREDSRFYARLSQWVSTLGCTGIFFIVFFANVRIVKLLSTTASLNTELTHVNSELQQFVYSASHDLREPLRTLVIYSQLVDRKTHRGLPIDDDLKHIRSASRLMTQIVEDLLTYTRTANEHLDHLQQADLNAVLSKVCDALGTSIAESGATIHHSDLPSVALSDVHARILLQNLVSNAIKYRKADQQPEIRVQARRDGQAWVVSVSDDGIGIRPEYQEQIFGIFKRLHTRSDIPGTGLGLAICKKIVDRYHGKIWVESEPGAGATFHFRIPDPASPQ